MLPTQSALESHAKDLKMVGVISNSRPECVELEIAASLYGFAPVHILKEYSEQAWENIINFLGVHTLFCEEEDLDRILTMVKNH
mmetsp:Transcript_34311/g.31027  ORF Transcript_34311/g.31027 Transcript_34311/m.31027 type:complete len:84 (-) Transcript_34311:32-283(-)